MIGIWVLLAIVVFGAVKTFGAETNNDLALPGTGSQQVKDLLTERFSPQQNGVNPIVFHVKTGKLTDDANKAAVKASVQALREAPHVYSVTNPLSSTGQTAGLLGKDEQYAFAPVLLDISSGDLDEAVAEEIFAAADPARDAGITVEAAGSLGATLSDEPTEISEVVGILAAMIILTFVLGSLVAMGMPIITAIFGLGIGLALIGLAGHVVNMPTTGATLATMIGLGVGIDYALFLITRHQDQLRDGMEMKESIARAVATAGSAIVFAGCTVVIALLSLRVAGIPLVGALGFASAIAVVTAVCAAVSLLPALLGLLGHRIHALALPGFMHPHKKEGPGMWARWAGFVSRHAVAVTLVSLALLVPLIIPVFSLELGQEDVGATNPETTERKAYDLITDGFGVGYNGPLQTASLLTPVAAPSDEYTKKYNKAMKLQSELEKAQKDLPKQQKKLEKQQAKLENKQAKLENQQATLERKQAALEAQAATLANEAAALEREKAALQKQEAQLRSKRAALRRDVEALRKQTRPLTRELGELRRKERRLERRIEDAQQAGDAALEAELKARLADVRDDQAQVLDDLEVYEPQAKKLADRARKLRSQEEALRRQAAALAREAAELDRQKASLEQQGAALQRQANQLRKQGNELKKQGDALQQQADELKAEQKQAQQEQTQAEKLQKELTDMVTAAGGDPRGTDPRVVALQSALSATPGVVSLTPPQMNTKGDVVILSAVPKTSPASNDTADLVGTVRDDVIPPLEADDTMSTSVGGYTASYVDLASLISARLLLVIGTVILLGIPLLMLAFRSLLVPLQAALTNILSAAAAFGVLTACFQWGWGVDLVGLDTASGTVPIASYVPLMMFAGLFGLSMDYEVFLVSHIQKHHAEGEEARRAVASGLAASARITTAAALIMASVFASFILNGDPTIKQFGVGLSVAVLLAGILVVTLAPAVLVLFGEAAWWLPRWLDRILPHISIEGDDAPTSSDPQRPAGEHAGPRQNEPEGFGDEDRGAGAPTPEPAT